MTPSRFSSGPGARLHIGWLPLVHADPDQMYSVLQNLLTNAVKFTLCGHPPLESRSLRDPSRTGGGSR